MLYLISILLCVIVGLLVMVLNILLSINENLVQSTAILKTAITQSVGVLFRRVNSHDYSGDSHD
jgi:hypothetical protein